MRNRKLVFGVALAAGLVVTSTLGQALVFTERRVQNTTNNWYVSEGRMVTVAGENRLAYDPNIVNEPNSSYPIVYFFLSIGGSPTSDSFAGVGQFTFPPQADGIEVQVHYQKAGDDWAVGTTIHTAGAQIVYCTNMVVPKGYEISLVVRVTVAGWVKDGTPINVELLGFTGLFGVEQGEIPEVQISPNTGPWRMNWWKHPSVQSIAKTGTNQFSLTVLSPPHFWGGNWGIETSTDLVSWGSVTATLLPVAGANSVNRILQVPFNGSEPRRFFRTVIVP